MSAPLPKRAFVCRAEIAPFRPHNRGPNARKQTGLALPAVMDLHAALFGASAPGGAPSREDSSVVVRRDAVGASSSGRKQAKADRKKARKAAGERRLEGETAPEGRRSKKRSRSASAAAGAKRGRAAASADADAPRGELGQLALASLRAGAPSLRAQREALPVLQHAEAIASALATSPSGAIVVVGETGSGKTTREPRRAPCARWLAVVVAAAAASRMLTLARVLAAAALPPRPPPPPFPTQSIYQPAACEWRPFRALPALRAQPGARPSSSPSSSFSRRRPRPRARACPRTRPRPAEVPQLLLMAGAAGPPSLPRGATVRRGQTIGVSQPRRVAATTISSRVAQEMGTSVGGPDGLVGYSVRFDTRAGPRTRVRFATDGMLLREAQTDHLLGRYGVMIVDEAHERSVSTDVLLGVVRRAMALRARPDSPLPPLRVVVMSATLDAQKFSRFFAAPAGEDGMGAVPDEVAEPSSGSADAAAACPVVTVPGRQHPVTVAYLSSPSDNVVDDAVAAAMQTHLADVGWPAAAGDEEAAIAQGFDPAAASLTDASLSRNGYLVFLPGAEEIDDAVSGLRARSEALPPSLPRLHVCPLYAALPPEVQMRAFDQPPPGARKVVVSTNIAETSVTVSGVSTVIDSGIVKVRGFASLTGIQTLRPAPVAQAQARQRAGRAGREGPGRCLRLFAEADWAMLRPQPEAEIHRASLDSVVLRLVSMGVHPGRVQAFPLIEAPPPESLRGSLTRLLQLRAVDASSGQLTARGHAMAALPVEPAAASLLLAAREAGCLEDMCAVVALSDAEGLLQTPRDKEAAAMRARRGFSAWEGDHVMMVRLWEAFRSVVQAVRGRAGGAAKGGEGAGGASTAPVRTVRFGGGSEADDEETAFADAEEGGAAREAASRPGQGKGLPGRRRAPKRRREPITKGMGRREAAELLEWCRKRFVSLRALRRADAVRCQLLDAVEAAEQAADRGHGRRGEAVDGGAGPAGAAREGGVAGTGGAVSASSAASAALRATAAATPASVGLPDGASDAEVRSAALRRALVAGFPAQLAQRIPAAGSTGRPEYRVAGSGAAAAIHPASCIHEHAHAAADRARSKARASARRGTGTAEGASSLWEVYPEWVFFGELVSTSRPYLRSVTRVEADWLPELAPDLFRRE